MTGPTFVQYEQKLTFRLLVGYRWVSLLPPLLDLLIFSPPQALSRMVLSLLVAAGLTLGLTLAVTPLNRRLMQHPWLLGIDLVISIGLVWATGLEQSPYYPYSLAPILAAAFFFGIRGGVTAAAFYSLLYGLAWLINMVLAAPVNLSGALTQVMSFFLIGAIFGYPTRLLQQLYQAHTELTAKNDELSTRNRDLDLLRELSLVMQSSVDPAEMQEIVLQGLVEKMGYPRAVIGLYDRPLDALTGWLVLAGNTATNGNAAPKLAHTDVASLKAESGPLARALKGRLTLEITDGEAPTHDDALNRRLILGSHYLILPLSLRNELVGVIVIDQLSPERRLSAAERHSLNHLAMHAGVALGSVRLCIDRARIAAVAAERHRMATDLHDQVSQALYGLAYGLDAAKQLLAHEPKLQQLLANLHQTAAEAQTQLRQIIFDSKPDEITAAAFVAGLHRNLRALSPLKAMALRLDLPGDFDHWQAGTRRQLYRVTQEALANTVKHANARQFIVKLSQDAHDIELRIADDGEGFDPTQVDSSQHLGLQSMAERIRALDGAFELNSAFGEGTLIIIRVPLALAEPADEVAVVA
ncbi:MAG: GAF domain-containing protein [Anaerolineae bacterium]|nr:GAF domain-containing protein [Anaerolineae bacterium]MCB9103500.1 GAF domain-containing protein [Anaerolineales bacterium]